MTSRHCPVCGHLKDHHVDPTDDLFAVPSTVVHGCHIINQPDDIDQLVDWQLHQSPAAQGEQQRRERAGWTHPHGRGWP